MKLLSKIKRKRDFRLLISESRPRLYRTAYSWCHNPDLADDLVQQTLYKALENYSQLRELKALNGWLFRILYRCFVNQKKYNREVALDDSMLGVEDYTPEIAAGAAHIVLKVRSAISTLSLEQRQAITLVDLEGFTYAEVAKILDIPVGTVMSRLSRGRKKLLDRLISLKNQKEKTGNTHVRRIK